MTHTTIKKTGSKPKEPENRIFSVSELTARIKRILEKQFDFIWVTGEISNFAAPSSGHFYFSLKDEQAVISAVMFRGANRRLKFKPENGMRITGLGRITVYEPRGNYQLIFEYIEPAGLGGLQAAFEQLKTRLSGEGLFDPDRKKPIPFLPGKIGVVTSPTGAVIHDIMNIMTRRFPGIPIRIAPVKVQGEGADLEIADALKMLNTQKACDVIIVARGGGSLEDLMAFNSEVVARAIFDSDIPVISAVGHETDFSIADFVADLRAPTPSAAAELVIPQKSDLFRDIHRIRTDLAQMMFGKIEFLRNRVQDLEKRLTHPKKRVQDSRLRVDDFTFRLEQTVRNYLEFRKERLLRKRALLYSVSPKNDLARKGERIKTLWEKVITLMQKDLAAKRGRLETLDSSLKALNPSAVLERGFSITRNRTDGKVIMDSKSVSEGDEIEITLARGKIYSHVKGTE